MPELPCACGCGELTFGEYKRGHRRNPPRRRADISDEDMEMESEGWRTISLDEAAEQTPDDPEPSNVERPATTPPIRITKRVREDVKGKLAFMLTMVGSMASIADPICGGAFLDNADNVAEKMTPLICKSPDMVAKITKSSDMMLYIDLVWAFWPIFTVAAGHHLGRKRVESVDATLPPQPVDNNVYTAA